MTQDNKKKKKFEPAPLTPGEEEPPLPTNDSPVKGILTTAFISLVVVLLINTFIMPVASKSAYQADITRLENDLVAIRTSSAKLSDKITAQDSSILAITTKSKEFDNSLVNYATKTDLANAVKQDLSGYATIIDLNKTKESMATDDQLEAQAALIKTLQSATKELENKITNLEKTGSTSTISTKVEAVGLIFSRWSEQFIFPADNTSYSTTIVFDVVNDLPKDIKDIEVQIIVRASASTSNFNFTYEGSYPWTWFETFKDSKTLVIAGRSPTYGRGLELVSGGNTSFYLPLTITANLKTDKSVTFWVEGEVIKYTVK